MNSSILQGIPLTEIHTRFGSSVSSLTRHRDRCIAPMAVKAKAAQDVFSAESIIRELAEVKRAAWACAERNKGVDDDIFLKSLAKVTGALDSSLKVAALIQAAQSKEDASGYSKTKIDLLKARARQLRLAAPEPEVIDIESEETTENEDD